MGGENVHVRIVAQLAGKIQAWKLRRPPMGRLRGWYHVPGILSRTESGIYYQQYRAKYNRADQHSIPLYRLIIMFLQL
jgi:hypothetical protein